MSQVVLKQHEQVLKLDSGPWPWRVLSLLRLNLEHVAAGGAPAVSLRLVEVFTSWESAVRVLGEDGAVCHLVRLFSHLVRRGYFRRVRSLVDDRTPPLHGPSPVPPTQLASCLLDLITRPLHVVWRAGSNEFR